MSVSHETAHETAHETTRETTRETARPRPFGTTARASSVEPSSAGTLVCVAADRAGAHVDERLGAEARDFLARPHRLLYRLGCRFCRNVADHLPDLTALGDPKRLRSGWLNGLTEWKVDLGVCPVAS
mgnify:CR=1 FL=1